MALFSVGINALSSRGINTGTSGAALAGGVHADAIEDRTPVSQRDLGRDPPHTTCASTQHQPAPHHSDGAVSGTMPCDCWRSLARSLTLDRTKDAAQGLKYSVWVHGPENADSDDAGESVEALASESTGYVPDQTSRLGNLEQRTAHALEAGDTPPTGPFRRFQAPIADIGTLTGLDLRQLLGADRLPAQQNSPRTTALTGRSVYPSVPERRGRYRGNSAGGTRPTTH